MLKKRLWGWGFVSLVALCTLALFVLYLTAVLDKQVDLVGKFALLAVAAVGVAATLMTGGAVIERRKGLAGLITPKSASLIFVAIIATFGLLTDVYGFLQPRPAVESEQGQIERNTVAILREVRTGAEPTQEERVAWTSLETNSCDALRRHIERFPNGAYAPQAAARLSARRTSEAEVWTPTIKSLVLRVQEEGSPATTEVAARLEAQGRGLEAAQRLCKGFAATSLFRLRSASVSVSAWTCTSAAGGYICGFSGEAVCELDVRSVAAVETCATGQ